MKIVGTCNLSGCSCKTERGKAYCSDYCRDAASHAPERDYCQCGHAGCAVPAGKGLDAQLFRFISLSPGQVTIECSTLDQLSEQLALLARAVADHSEEVRTKVEPRPARISAASDTHASVSKAQFA